MKKTIQISTKHFNQMNIDVNHLLEEIHQKREMLGELCHEPKTVNVIDSNHCAFMSKYLGNDKILIETNHTLSGNILHDILENDTEDVVFMPRILITENAHSRIVQFITFDAIITNKELWERF